MNGIGILFGLMSGLAVLIAADVRSEDRGPEPAEYRTKDYRAPTPAGLAGARIVSTAETERLWQDKTAVFVDVLPRAVTLPVGNVKDDALRPCGLVDELDHAAELPGQSPW